MAQYYTCSKYPEHQSIDADYCSMCGAKIVGATSSLPLAGMSLDAASVPAVPTPNTAGICPDCGTPRSGSAKFCEICRYNYDTGASGGTVAPPQPVAPGPAAPPLPVLDMPAVPITAPTIPQPALPASVGVSSWELIVTADAALYVEPDPSIPFPFGEPERTFPIDFAENLIGRRSDRKDIHPEIPLTDPGVSHRHAKVLRQADGTFVLLDVGSTNGTRLNGVPVAEGVRTPLSEGDEIMLGCWTRLRFQKVQP